MKWIMIKNMKGVHHSRQSRYRKPAGQRGKGDTQTTNTTTTSTTITMITTMAQVLLTDWKLSDLGSPLSDLAFLLFSSADQATRLEQRQQLVRNLFICHKFIIIHHNLQLLKYIYFSFINSLSLFATIHNY